MAVVAINLAFLRLFFEQRNIRVRASTYRCNCMIQPFLGEKCYSRETLRDTYPGLNISEATVSRCETFTSFKRCAVVLNSGILNRVEPPLGELIDAHDAVIRFNSAPVGGNFTRSVGQRTTMRITHIGHPPTLHPNDTYFYQLYSDEHANTFVEFEKENKGRIFALSGAYIDHVWGCTNRTRKWSSSGFVGVNLALSFCNDISLFGTYLNGSGFDKSLGTRQYWRAVHKDPLFEFNFKKHHPVEQEEAQLRCLRDTHRISVYPLPTVDP